MDTESNIPLIVIVGPTASGKSAFAMHIAKKYHGELICADSRTVYKDMDIGTAKPTHEDRAQVPHHLLDVVEPGQPFSAAQFKKLANAAIIEISARNHLPIIVGGTGLYVDSVIFNYEFGEAADPSKRSYLTRLSTQELQEICSNSNIEIPINKHNRRHLIRAIEMGGVKKQPKLLRKNTLVVGITTEKEILSARITKRAEAMFKGGVIEEGRKLAREYGWTNEAMTGNIYPVIHDLTGGSISLEEAVQKFIMNDVHLAKRQLTWFKRNPHIVWGNPEELECKIEEFLGESSASIA